MAKGKNAVDYNKLAKDIIANVGGKDNIKDHLHCATRLRLVLEDNTKVDRDVLNALDGIMGVVDNGEQLQMIIGTSVGSLYEIVAELVPLKTETVHEKPKREKNKVAAAMEMMAGIFAPIIPIIAGSGLLKTLLTICIQLGWMTEASETYQILYIAADAVFKFIPIVLAYSAAKTFKTNIIIALTLTAAMFYPTLTNASAEGIEYLHLFGGIPVKVVDASSTVIPVLLTIWLLKYVYDFVERLIPEVLRTFLTSFVVLPVMLVIELTVFVPLGSYLGILLMNGLEVLIGASKLVSGAVIGALWIPLVVTGMHHGVIPLLFQEIASNGYTILMPATNMANVALAASVAAVLVKSKDQRTKAIAAAATPSGCMGITEPGIYGIMIKYRGCLLATMVGGAIGGAYIVVTGAVQYFFGGLGVFTPLMNLGTDKFIHHVIATVLAFAVSFIIAYVTFKDAALESDQPS